MNRVPDRQADMCDHEQLSVNALPQKGKPGTGPAPKGSIENHNLETQPQVTEIARDFQGFAMPAHGKTSAVTRGMAGEGCNSAMDFQDSPTMNAAQVTTTPRAEHYYEMTSYGCLHEWAGPIGNKK